MQAQHRARVWLILEVAVIALWAAYITRPYLNSDPALVPIGADYGSSMQSHFLWDHARSCGLCALWNGDLRGGAPAFADIHGDMLHPAAMIPSLLFGALTGTKVAIAATLFLGGLAQWWLARVLGLGRFVRVWSGMAAVAAGHLAGRIENGNVALITSTAACAFVFPAVVNVYRSPGRRSAALLGLSLAGAAVAGQGYLQVGLLMLLPLSLLLLLKRPSTTGRALASFGTAAVIGALVAAPFLIPFLRIWPSFTKDRIVAFDSAQDFANVPLNLVIGDHSFYLTESLDKLPFPYLYVNFIGWIVVGLAVVGMATLWRSGTRPLMLVLSLWAIGAMWISSATPFDWIWSLTGSSSRIGEFVAGIRYPSVIAGLAVPPIIGLAGAGLEALLRHNWSALAIRFEIQPGSESGRFNVTLRAQILVFALALVALNTLRGFSEDWIRVSRTEISNIDAVLDRLETPDLQWVQPPFGEQWWIPFTADRGLKVADAWRPWGLDGHALPPPMLEASRNPDVADMEAQPPPVDGVQIFVGDETRTYASVMHTNGTRTPCAATGEGGHIDVRCESDQPGQLVVLENNLGGWNATVNGNGASVAKNGQWVAVDVPAGDSLIELRYRPWDVWVGLALMAIGIVWAALWLIDPNRRWLPPALAASVERRKTELQQRFKPDSPPPEGHVTEETTIDDDSTRTDPNQPAL